MRGSVTKSVAVGSSAEAVVHYISEEGSPARPRPATIPGALQTSRADGLDALRSSGAAKFCRAHRPRMSRKTSISTRVVVTALFLASPSCTTALLIDLDSLVQPGACAVGLGDMARVRMCPLPLLNGAVSPIQDLPPELAGLSGDQ